MRLSLFSSLNNRKHMRVPRKPSLIFSLNNRKRQDLKSCSVALCAITFQLQPCFPWNCAPLEQKNGPAIQNIRFQATAIFANFLVFFWRMCYLILYFPVDKKSTWIIQFTTIYRRKFRSQTSDNMERWKAEQGRGREKRKIRREKIRRERVRRKKMQMREKVGKSRNTVFFQWFVEPEGRKVGSLKRRVRSQLARWEMKKCTPLWREAHLQVKMYKTHHGRTTFGSWDVEKVHAVVARSTFPSQNVQNTSVSDDFWKLRCRKSARRCGAKHISKWKCTKHTILGALLEVEMSKKCTPLWREAHFEVKSVKNWRSRTTFGGSDVENVSKKCTPLWREAHFEVKSVKNWGFWAFFDVKMSKK